MTTLNDVLISILILPGGLSYWSKRRPGTLFGNQVGCGVWLYLWQTAVALSIFLVICLSVTRTICLLNPFKQQRVKYLIIAVVMYLGSTVVVTVGGHIQDGARISFNPRSSKCEMVLTPESDEDVLLILEIFTIISYVVPVFVVAVSCVLSAALLTQSNEQLQQRELQQARNRATVTILLFALVYGVCNIPIVIEIILLAYSWHTDNMKWYHEMKQFDLQLYYSNAISTLLLAVNSAANPILYFWRLPPLREFTLTATGRILRLEVNRDIQRPPNVTRQDHTTTEFHNNSVVTRQDHTTTDFHNNNVVTRQDHTTTEFHSNNVVPELITTN